MLKNLIKKFLQYTFKIVLLKVFTKILQNLQELSTVNYYIFDMLIKLWWQNDWRQYEFRKRSKTYQKCKYKMYGGIN